MSVTSVPYWLRGAQAFQAGVGAPRLPSPPASAIAAGAGAELVSLAAAMRHRAAWEGLCARALEPSAFLEPAFVLAAALHIAVSKRPKFLLVWDTPDEGAARRLIGLCPIHLPMFASAGAATVWLSKQCSAGSPLLDKEMAFDALQAMVELLGASRVASPALMFSKVPQAGKTAALIRALAAAAGHRLELSDAHERASLTGGPAAQAAFAASVSPKKLKELGRQRRRLEDGGAVTFVSAVAAQDVLRAIEDFLSLEAKGWKGKCGTAFLSSPGQTAFLRALTRDLASQGKCRVDMLLRAGKPVAMGIVLRSGDSGAFWKTAFDEDFAACSPGVQLCLEITRRQIADADYRATDSCAIANHPMIDHIWPQRIAVADMLLAIQRGKSLHYTAALLRAQAARALIARLRGLFCRLTGRKIS